MRYLSYLTLSVALFVLTSMAAPWYQNTLDTSEFECDTKHDCPGNEVCAGKSPLLACTCIGTITNIQHTIC